MEGLAFKPYLSSQIYAALDVYIAILNGVRRRTLQCLGRHGRDWRLANACPCCQYRLKEEQDLAVRMLGNMDGNDSLKRMERKEDILREQEDEGVELPTRSKERVDRREAGSQYFLSRAETDRWDEKNWSDAAAVDNEGEATPSDGWAEGLCEERWSNMQENKTVKSAAKYAENGWFVLLCRHMIFLVGCDMIKSGER